MKSNKKSNKTDPQIDSVSDFRRLKTSQRIPQMERICPLESKKIRKKSKRRETKRRYHRSGTKEGKKYFTVKHI